MSKKYNKKNVLILILAQIVVIIVWHIIAQITFPSLSPLMIFTHALSYYGTNEFITAFINSLQRVMAGFVIASFLGISIGILMGLYEPVDKFLEPIIAIIRPIAPLAWVPMVIIWFGLSGKGPILIITFTCFFPIIVNTVTGVKTIDIKFKEVALTLGAKRSFITRHVIFPGAFLNILIGLRISVALSWAVIVAAEMTISGTGTLGIGALMFKYSMITYSLKHVVSLMVSVGIIGFLSDQFIQYIAAKLVPWQKGVKV